ncbi:MAG: extracellular solute-binding protein [Planctomycetota bacterium]|jgi:iron(III) transport system substrate-binding protein
MRTFVYPAVIVVAAVAVFWILYEKEAGVVLYCGVDQDQSRQIAEAFQAETGVPVRYEGETEAQRSIGLAQKLLQERDSPRADLWWSNEIMNMVDLSRKGLLAPLPPGVGDAFPPMWRDPEGRYVAFGARARILLVNTELLPDRATWPKSVADLLHPRYAAMGLKTCMARPLTGTTYTHAVALLVRDETQGRGFLEAVVEASRAGHLKLANSNGSAMSLVRRGEDSVAFCLTDTDDAWVAIREGDPVQVVYPDQEEGEMGAVLIPNTVALIQGGPHPEKGLELLQWLISRENELRLAHGPSAQIPLRKDLADADVPAHVKRPGVDFRPAVVDWQAVGENRDRWLDYLSRLFRPAP